MQLLPGKAIFSPPKPKVPAPAPAPEPKQQTTVERDDPDVTEAREKLRQSELKRKGRRSTILAGTLDDEATLGRPTAGRGNVSGDLG